MPNGQLNGVANLNVGLHARGAVGHLNLNSAQFCGRCEARLLGERTLPATIMRLSKCLRAVEVDVSDDGQHGNVRLPIKHISLFAVLKHHVAHCSFCNLLTVWVVFAKGSRIKNPSLNGCSIVLLALKARYRALLDLIKPSLWKDRTLSHFCTERKKILGVLAQTACTYSESGSTQTSSNKINLFVERFLAEVLGSFRDKIAENS